MNIGIGTFLKNGLTKEGIESALRRVVAAITAGFQVEHREDGTHSDVTCDTLTVAAVTTDGNVTGSLVPTTATQDLGAEIAKASAVAAFRPWRDLNLSRDIQWGDFSESGIVNGAPVIARSSRSLTVTCGASGAAGSLTITTFTAGAGCTLTISGGVSSSTSLTATTVITGASYQIADGVTAPSSGGGFAALYIDSADGDFKIKFADGTVKVLASNP